VQKALPNPLVSVIIPARCEEWLSRTVRDVLGNAKAETEVIAVCDGSWPDPPLQDHPRLTVLHYTQPIGQRGAFNQGARVSRAKYVMKLDGHASVDSGFDVKLVEPYESGKISMDTTTIPRMRNLHVYDWECQGIKADGQPCKWRTYQGRKPTECPTCKGTVFAKAEVWGLRRTTTDFACFDRDMKFQYWQSYGRRPEAQGDITDVLSSVGACFFMPRSRFWAQGGLDESHGFWGQFGTEVSCKAWLSGGRQVVNKTTYFAHYFRVNGAGFPYPISGNDQDRARHYSQAMWLNNKWEQQVRPLSWLVEKFWPVKDWSDEDLAKIKQAGAHFATR